MIAKRGWSEGSNIIILTITNIIMTTIVIESKQLKRADGAQVTPSSSSSSPTSCPSL